MKFSDLENGMAVKFNNGAIGMVYKGFMTYDYIICNTGEYISRNGPDLEDSLESLKNCFLLDKLFLNYFY